MLYQSGNTEISKLLDIGWVKYLDGRYKDAREMFRQAFLLDPTNEKILGFIKMADETISDRNKTIRKFILFFAIILFCCISFTFNSKLLRYICAAMLLGYVIIVYAERFRR